MDFNGLADPYVKLHLLPGACKVLLLSQHDFVPGSSCFILAIQYFIYNFQAGIYLYESASADQSICTQTKRPSGQ